MYSRGLSTRRDHGLVPGKRRLDSYFIYSLTILSSLSSIISDHDHDPFSVSCLSVHCMSLVTSASTGDH